MLAVMLLTVALISLAPTTLKLNVSVKAPKIPRWPKTADWSTTLPGRSVLIKATLLAELTIGANNKALKTKNLNFEDLLDIKSVNKIILSRGLLHIFLIFFIRMKNL